ncbi:hypothetical protein ONZ45_g19451 [Pleurotus djamor]|nr:hypothetical protein ONZ45_g19451 [Pleurotus djamor]
MDYDRWDAVLHYIFQQTQGDEWFRPDESRISSGVAVRIHPGYIDLTNAANNEFPQYRIFPYERKGLEPFEQAVVGLNPVVAVKVRNATIHASLAETSPRDTSLYVDSNTRIQILETMLDLPSADKEQCAAFIRDERVLVVWSQSIDSIVPICNEFEERLIKLLWRTRPSQPQVASDAASTITGVPVSRANTITSGKPVATRNDLKHSRRRSSYSYGAGLELKEDDDGLVDNEPTDSSPFDFNRERPTMLYASLYNGIAAALALDIAHSQFFCLHLVQNISMAIGPVAHYHENSKYYSAAKPPPNKVIDNNLPHITIQMPVYKESLETVLMPSIMSLKKAMQTYARQGGSSTIFINDDGHLRH